eukprot:TRINITY_DN3233_c0_g1_i2.p1 TRINITY_DN3233_c0_g1~~TRINITY_DN3233_c0_g1_i2.p1  ORF type:complete len:428 (+),score=60.93 TRINITY_DN3233_c0_g1_i2:742-2025(+)
MYKEAQDTITSGFDRQPYTPEQIRLWCFGNGKTLKDFLSASREQALEKNKDKVPLYAPEHQGWRRIGFAAKRADSSLILDDEGKMGDIIADIEQFLTPQTKAKYRELGVPYRRGYLLYGPPGNGKSSLVSSISSKLCLPTCILSINTQGMDDNKLQQLLRDTPNGSIILLEDVDSLFRHRTPGSEGSDLFVTFSGLLNALDGVASQEGRIIIMTTNLKENLDEALLRPGRCDKQLFLGNATSKQASLLFDKFIKPQTPQDMEYKQSFCDFVGSGRYSMADLQGHFLQHDTPFACLQGIKSLRPSNVAERPESLSAFLRRIGLKQYASTFQSIGVNWLHELRSSPYLLDEVEGLSTYHRARIESNMNSDNSTTPDLVAHLIERRGWGSSPLLVSALSGRVIFEAAAEWIQQQPSLQDALANAEHFVAD